MSIPPTFFPTLSEFCIGEKEMYRHILVLNYSGLEEARTLEVVRVLGEIFRPVPPESVSGAAVQ